MASRLLPGKIQRDVVSLYAWCRSCDDAVDQAMNMKVATNKLADLREDVFRIHCRQPVLQAESRWLEPLMRRYPIPPQIPLDFLDGMQADLGQIKLESEEQLLRYCYQAAGTVGLMMCQMLGTTHEAAGNHAKSLGIAMQLTNIARDVGEDWRMGRRYLPRVWMPFDPDVDPEPTNRQVMYGVRKALELAEQQYQHGLAGIPYLPVLTRPAIRTAAAVYREIGRQIEREGCWVMHRRAVVPAKRKCLLVLRSLGEELCCGCAAFKLFLTRKRNPGNFSKDPYAGEIGR